MGKGSGMRWTEADLAKFQGRAVQQSAPAEESRIAALIPKAEPAPTGKAKLQALGRLRDGSLNKTETAYAAFLDVQKHAGEVLWWAFEGIKLRLADRTHLTIDFAVLDSNGVLKMIDVKGAKAIVQDDARAKTKIAARLFPFQFYFVYPDKASGGWITEEI